MPSRKVTLAELLDLALAGYFRHCESAHESLAVPTDLRDEIQKYAGVFIQFLRWNKEVCGKYAPIS